MPPKLIRVFQTVRNKIQICTTKNDNYEKNIRKKKKKEKTYREESLLALNGNDVAIKYHVKETFPSTIYCYSIYILI